MGDRLSAQRARRKSVPVPEAKWPGQASCERLSLASRTGTSGASWACHRTRKAGRAIATIAPKPLDAETPLGTIDQRPSKPLCRGTSHQGGYVHDRLASPRFRKLCAIEVQHKKPNSRRQIIVLPLGIDYSNQARYRYVAFLADFPQAIPECVLDSHASLVPTNHE